jgi:hypothetical protein
MKNRNRMDITFGLGTGVQAVVFMAMYGMKMENGIVFQIYLNTMNPEKYQLLNTGKT